MPDPSFFDMRNSISGDEILEILNTAGLIVRSGSSLKRTFSSIQSLANAGPRDISFFHNSKYLNDLDVTKAGLVIVPKELAVQKTERSNVLGVDDVHRAMSLVGNAFVIEPEMAPGIHPSANIDPSAVVDLTAEVGAFVHIGPGAVIGAKAKIASNVSIGRGVQIGPGCQIDANVTLSHAILGARVHIKPGAAIGQRGFGWALGPTGHVPKPQLGLVVIGNDVEIGSNCAIDRGSVENTEIGDGTVIDNLCHIAHNCKIGRFCALAATIAFAGSTTLGDFVIMGGGVAAKGHIHIADGTFAKAWTFIGRNTKPGEVLVGNPARSSEGYQRLLRNWSRIARGVKGS